MTTPAEMSAIVVLPEPVATTRDGHPVWLVNGETVEAAHDGIRLDGDLEDPDEVRRYERLALVLLAAIRHHRTLKAA